MKKTEHYIKMFFPNSEHAIYLCDSYKDMDYIPTVQCQDGDKVIIKNGHYYFIFQDGKFVIYK